MHGVGGHSNMLGGNKYGVISHSSILGCNNYRRG